jgi:hypothetical protein
VVGADSLEGVAVSVGEDWPGRTIVVRNVLHLHRRVSRVDQADFLAALREARLRIPVPDHVRNPVQLADPLGVSAHHEVRVGRKLHLGKSEIHARREVVALEVVGGGGAPVVELDELLARIVVRRVIHHLGDHDVLDRIRS